MVVIFDIRHNNLRLITVAWTSNKIAQAQDDRTDIKPKGIVHEAGRSYIGATTPKSLRHLGDAASWESALSSRGCGRRAGPIRS